MDNEKLLEQKYNFKNRIKYYTGISVEIDEINEKDINNYDSFIENLNKDLEKCDYHIDHLIDLYNQESYHYFQYNYNMNFYNKKD